MRDRIVRDEFGRGLVAFQRLRDATADAICDIAASTADDFQFTPRSYRSARRSLSTRG